ncbi:MAG: response regulator transcription factor [Candidatus Acidiferrales bacterium]
MKIIIDSEKCGVGKTVLVVDDNARIRKLLAVAFLSDGFTTCVQAENGKEGIEAAKQIKPDVITLDFSMPGMIGLATASELRRLFPKTPIILFTLYADSLLRTDASKAGVSLVLLKTAPLPTLIHKARELMENYFSAVIVN